MQGVVEGYEATLLGGKKFRAEERTHEVTRPPRCVLASAKKHDIPYTTTFSSCFCTTSVLATEMTWVETR